LFLLFLFIIIIKIKVKVQVEKGKRLGLVIRGGSEYGLGIFISGVDKGSLSDQSGLCIGDQILSVNGIDFLHITHKDAVNLLRNLNDMTFHLRQINKLPKPKDFVKQIITKSPKINQEMNILSSSSNRLINSKKKTNFIDLIIDQNEKIKIKNLLKQYLEENFHIDQLIKYLLQILNQQHQLNRVYFHLFIYFK